MKNVQEVLKGYLIPLKTSEDSENESNGRDIVNKYRDENNK